MPVSRAVLAIGGVMFGGVHVAHAQLPVPCGAGACNGKSGVSAGQMQAPTIAGNTMRITQLSDRLTLNWQSFDIGAQNAVVFEQPSSSAVALNRIFQNDPSRIHGRLSANGQIYLINQNGILFGAGSQTNVHTLVASTLDISDEVFQSLGLTNAINSDGRAAFEGAQSMGAIAIEAGARLATVDGGRIMILAPRIENHGEISTPGGQAILAASHDKVYLANADDPNLRGLLVEVATGGDVRNVGTVVAERGNVSLVGLAVNQSGTIRATTSVNLNGSVRLLARDGVTLEREGEMVRPLATRAGILTLGTNSLTAVTPDDVSETAVDAQAQPTSHIELMGKTVTLETGARVVAPGGDVTLVATQTPQSPGPSLSTPDNDARVELQPGSLIDVSGLESAVLPMQRNVVEVELRGNELRDAPLQRNGPLRNQTVAVDIRKGTPFADVSGQMAAIKRPLGERLASGGRVSIVADGEVVTGPGAQIDVSGGAVTYEGGPLATTKVISQGRIYDIAEADPDLPYEGVLTPESYEVENRKWGVTTRFDLPGLAQVASFEAGYVEGKDAGSATINARRLDLHGSIRGARIIGAQQRRPTTLLDSAAWTRRYDEVPLGGKLVLGRDVAADGDRGLGDFALSSLEALGVLDVTRLQVYANGQLTLPEQARLELAPGGELSLLGGDIQLSGAILAPGGNVQVKATGGLSGSLAGSLDLAASAHIDVSGTWVNDGAIASVQRTDASGLFIDGGSVSLQAVGDINLAAGSSIAANGGAQLTADGALQAGRGGDIAIVTKPLPAPIPAPSALHLDAELSAYALERGGRLSLTGPGFVISDMATPAAPGEVNLPTAFFQNGGFSNYTVTATHTGIELVPGAVLELRADNSILGADYWSQPSGADLREFSHVGRLLDYQRQPVSLGLTLERVVNVDAAPRVELGAASRIDAELGAKVSLHSDTQLWVNGRITAPAGTVELGLVKPIVDNERGFDATQMIWLGPQGDINVAAQFQPLRDTSNSGLRVGTVRAAGQVAMEADRGYIVASEGSSIDVSGLSATVGFNVDGLIEPMIVTGAAGRIDLAAAEGMVLNGALLGSAGGAEGSAGGTLSMALDHSNRGGRQLFENEPAFPTTLRQLVLAESADIATPEHGVPVPDALNGVVQLGASIVEQGGFDSLELHSHSASTDPTSALIGLKGDVQLALRHSLILDAPVLQSDGGRAELSAAYVRLGTDDASITAPIAPEGGTGSVRVHAGHLDLQGMLALRGFGSPEGAAPRETASVQFDSEGDLRLMGGRYTENRADAIYAIGRLDSTADLSLRAAQVYTATASDFTLAVAGDAGRITIRPNGSAAAPLSAASRLTLSAADIEQHGTLRAPFGQIELIAAERAMLAEGSVTSVSGAGLTVPFGITEFGEDWLYPLGNYRKVYTAAPEKAITLSAPALELAPGSRIDVAGGGDLVAREFRPGPGGSRDILTGSADSAAFAVVPGIGSRFGSFDPFLSGTEPAAGKTINIGPDAPLPAGEYAVLPPAYALLPGAYLVTPVAAAPASQAQASIAQHDGSFVVTGQFGVAGTSIRDSLWSTFRVENGAQVRARAEYLESRADAFFAASGAENPLLNKDAGRLVLDAGTRLSLGGSLVGSSAGGRGSEADIIADRLAVVASATGSTERVELLAADLNVLGAESLLLGGRRKDVEGADQLTIAAQDVRIERGSQVLAPEVILAARESVVMEANAELATTGSTTASVARLHLTNDGAIVRASTVGQVQVERGTADAGAALIDIAPGASIGAAVSITLDSGGGVNLLGTLHSDGGSVSLAAGQISLGDVGQVSTGLALSSATLSQLNARELRLTSRGSIDLHGDLNLTVDRLELDAGGLSGYGSAGQAAILRADTLTIANRAVRVPLPLAAGRGDLKLDAREVVVGEGDFAVSGFAATTISATEQIVAKPEAGSAAELRVAGELALEAGRITGNSGANLRIATVGDSTEAVGALSISTTGDVAALPAVEALGARLELLATAIDYRGNVVLPSGVFVARATGSQGVTVAQGASIDVAGRDIAFADLRVGSPGGDISLVADAGAINIAADAQLDVSGAASGGDAGVLSVRAPGGTVSVSSDAQLLGSASAAARSGRFGFDAQGIDGAFSDLNERLNAGGFAARRELRVRSGDLTVAAGDTIKAHEIKLSADAGRIDIYGSVAAAGASGGRVSIHARDDLVVHSSGRIDAHAAGETTEPGGYVELGTVSGRIELQAADTDGAATIDVSRANGGGAAADLGRVILRVPRVDGSGMGLLPVRAKISGAQHVDIEATRVYQEPALTDALMATIESDTAAFMTNSDAVKSSAGVGSDGRFRLLPGVEIQSPQTLTLEAAWDLLTWRYADAPGVLTLRSAGDLALTANLSDGIALEAPAIPDFADIFPARDVVQTGQSWSYRIVAGADLSGADPLSVTDSAADITLSPGVKLRTGTGSIELAAARDLRLGDSAAAIYTTGENRGTGAVPAGGTGFSAELIKELLYQGDFLDKGGDIRIAVGGDVVGADGHQLVNDWQSRVGGEVLMNTLDGGQEALSIPASWAINVGAFAQNIGTLGGGDISVRAGGGLDNLSVVLPTTGQPSRSSAESSASIAGGGDLEIEVGADITSGAFYVSQGQAAIRAGGSVTHTDSSSAYPILALDDGLYDVRAREDLVIETILNPSVLAQRSTQGGYPDVIPVNTESYFYTYANDSAVRLSAVAGNVQINGDLAALRQTSSTVANSNPAVLGHYPGTLSARSLQADIVLGGGSGGLGLTLLPAPHGDLELIAGGSILPGSSSASVLLSDFDSALLPSVHDPVPGLADNLVVALRDLSRVAHAPVPTHADDPQPVRIVARGDIGPRDGGTEILSLVLAKPIHLHADGDITGLTLKAQHIEHHDISTVVAGGSIEFPTRRGSLGEVLADDNVIEISGPGQLLVSAGEDIDLGASRGILSVGNVLNPALAERGAAITAVAGADPAPDFEAFIQRYFQKSNLYSDALASYLAERRAAGVGVEALRNLPVAEQQQIIYAVLFEELRASGVAAANNGNSDYARGYDAITTLFPTALASGNIQSFLSRISTLDGNDINLVVPGGEINAGVATSAVVDKKPGELGVVAQRDGDVRAVVRDDFLVNQSRVFALDGGSILIWSSQGDIDAGRGAKTALSVPPPVTTFDAEGNIVVEFPPAIAGSGIRAAVTTPGRKPGDVYLFAPKGVVDAGDAGIGAAGNITIAATEVLGADNIDIGGVAVGIPVGDNSLAAGLTGVSGLASSVAKDAEASLAASVGSAAQSASETPLADQALSFLEVVVEGFGDEEQSQ